MRRCYSLILSTIVLATSACSDPPKPEKAKDLDQIKPADDPSGSGLGAIPSGAIAKVGSVEIPAETFREIYDLKIKKYTDRGREIPASADRRYRKSIAERLIYHEVLAQEAAKLGIEYDKEALAERESQQKRGIRDWDKHLQRRGETEQSLREMYIAELREKAILEKLGKLEVTPEEIEADYEKIKGNWKSDKPRVRASHILVPIGPQDRPTPGEKPEEPSDEEKKAWEAEAKTKAEELHKQVTAAGADFDKLAEEHSTGPSAQKGGDIGIFTADRMAEEFSEVAFKLNVGDISKPVKTKFGYHIIKVTGKWPAGELPKEALEDQIVNRLRQRKLHQGRRELKDDLLGRYEVVDNIKPTLGPEPARPTKRPTPTDRTAERRTPPGTEMRGAQRGEPEGDDGHGHGHGHGDEGDED